MNKGYNIFDVGIFLSTSGKFCRKGKSVKITNKNMVETYTFHKETSAKRLLFKLRKEKSSPVNRENGTVVYVFSCKYKLHLN